MGLDSVEIVLAVEETFGIEVSDGEAAALGTPGELIGFVCSRVDASPDSGACISQKVFHQVRASLMATGGTQRGRIRLRSKVFDLFPQPSRKERWREFCDHAQFDSLPSLTWRRGRYFAPITVRDIVVMVSSDRLQSDADTRGWTKSEVREAVRLIIAEQIGETGFSDDAEFIRDLGID